MASSLQSFEPRVRQYESSSLGRPASNQPTKQRWEMRISFGQVVVLWAVLAGMMVMVFIFGLHAGREQGLSRALEQSEAEAVRLPIARPIPEADESGNIPLATDEILDTEVIPSELASNEADDREFDFSRTEKVAGLSSKPALELFKEDEAAVLAKETAKLAAIEEEQKQQRLEKEAKALSAKLAEKEKQQKAAKKIAELSQLSPPLKKVEAPAAVVQAPVEKVEPEAVTAETTKKIKVEETNTKLSAGWYVQAAATRAKDDAISMIAKFNEKGLDGVLEQAKVRKKEYYRVLVGPYASKPKALEARAKVKSAGVTGGEPFLKHVK